MNHPKIVALKGFSFAPMTIVLEYAPRGNLYDFLQTAPHMSVKLRLRIATELAQALAFLHSCDPPFIHNDVKSPNVLV